MLSMEGERVVQHVKHEAQLGAAAPGIVSPSSSPSHDFSFIASLHSGGKEIPGEEGLSPFAVDDCSPADKIFFHGHLLPLRLFSHLPVSMSRCSSANSLDSFTLPIDKLLDDDDDDINNNNNNHYAISDDQFISVDHHPSHVVQTNTIERQVQDKSKFFLLFKCPRWRRRAREKDHEDELEERKPKFNISCTMKRYLRLINLFIPLTRTHRQRNSKMRRHRPYSFSSNIEKASEEGKSQGHRGEISAPASMRTSRTNSGLLMASEALTISTKSDSTMEELQATIQAAIAHCKKSIATDDLIECV